MEKESKILNKEAAKNVIKKFNKYSKDIKKINKAFDKKIKDIESEKER